MPSWVKIRTGVVGATFIATVGCNSNNVTKPAPVTESSRQEVRHLRRMNDLVIGDARFLNHDLNNAILSYRPRIRDADPLISLMARRKLATVYEVNGNEKGSLVLLKEIAAEKNVPLATDPLTSLKILYLSEKLHDKDASEKAMANAVETQRKMFSVMKDPNIAPGLPRNTYFTLATEASRASDWVLFNWSIEHARKSKDLTDQQWLQVAKSLETVDENRASEIAKRIETKVSGDDRQLASMIWHRVKDRSEARKSNSRPAAGHVQIPDGEKFKETGYWPTGVEPLHRRMGRMPLRMAG